MRKPADLLIDVAGSTMERQYALNQLDAALVFGLSRPLHQKPEFIGLTMATVCLSRIAREGQLELVYSRDEKKATQLLARSYEMIADFFLRCRPSNSGTRLVLADLQSDRTVFCCCLASESATLAIVFWEDSEAGVPLLELLSNIVDDELRKHKRQRSCLSSREIEVISMIADGHTSEDIARELGLAESTVNTHVKSAMRKTKSRSRTHLISIAIRNGFI